MSSEVIPPTACWQCGHRANRLSALDRPHAARTEEGRRAVVICIRCGALAELAPDGAHAPVKRLEDLVGMNRQQKRLILQAQRFIASRRAS